MNELQLTYSGPRYPDRTLPLETGEIAPEGIELTVRATSSIGRLLQQLIAGETDVAELLLGEYMAHVGSGGSELVGLPVFPARRFAQRWLWVPRDSGLQGLEDLRGKRIGSAPRALGGLVWALCLLRAQAAIEPGEVTLVRGRMGGSLEPILDGVEAPAEEAPLVERLLDGELDCLLSPYPIPHGEGGDEVRLLLPDPAANERGHVRAGGAMPILTVVAIRRELYERDRWIAWSLADAFAAAKALGVERLNYLGALAVALPWLSNMLEEIDELFDGDAYPYGLERNRGALEEYARTARETGLVEVPASIDALFAPEVLAHPGVPDPTRYGVPMRGTPRGVRG
jgi:4,5-dihydroxyphthalate decarboxylase